MKSKCTVIMDHIEYLTNISLCKLSIKTYINTIKRWCKNNVSNDLNRCGSHQHPSLCRKIMFSPLERFHHCPIRKTDFIFKGRSFQRKGRTNLLSTAPPIQHAVFLQQFYFPLHKLSQKIIRLRTNQQRGSESCLKRKARIVRLFFYRQYVKFGLLILLFHKLNQKP